MLYKDEKEQTHLAHSFYYNWRGNAKYLLFLYKEPLNNEKNILDGWNYLDDNSYNIVVIDEEILNDFSYGFETNQQLKDIQFLDIEKFNEIDIYLNKKPLVKNQVMAFVMK